MRLLRAQKCKTYRNTSQMKVLCEWRCTDHAHILPRWLAIGHRVCLRRNRTQRDDVVERADGGLLGGRAR